MKNLLETWGQIDFTMVPRPSLRFDSMRTHLLSWAKHNENGELKDFIWSEIVLLGENDTSRTALRMSLVCLGLNAQYYDHSDEDAITLILWDVFLN